MVQLGFHITETMAKELHHLVEHGVFKDENDAINNALILLMKQYKTKVANARISHLREKLGKEKYNITKEVIDSHPEEDL